MRIDEYRDGPRVVGNTVIIPPARKSRQTKHYRIEVQNILLPVGSVRRTGWAKPSESVATFLKRVRWDVADMPTMLCCDGQYYSRSDWHLIRFRDFRVIQLQSMPRGGGAGGVTKKQGLALVATLALLVAAVVVGQALGAAAVLGLSAASWTAVIFAAGQIAISYFLRPKTPKADPNSQDKLSTLALGGNAARIGDPLPIPYGRMRWAPDRAATDFRDFGTLTTLSPGFTDGTGGGTAQTNARRYGRTFKLLSLGPVPYDLEELQLGETTIWTKAGGIDSRFVGVLDIEITEAGDPVTLFPTRTRTSTEVNGQELHYDPGGLFPPPNNWVGPFVANAASTQAKKIAVDLVFPRGMGAQGRSQVYAGEIKVRAEYRPIDNAGVPTGSYTLLFEKTYRGTKFDQEGYTEEVAVTPGRYEVRVRRTSDPVVQTGETQVLWAGMKAVLVGQDVFPVKTIAIKAVAGKQFAEYTPSDVWAIGTRILPVWNGSAFVDEPSRNVVWAAYDALTAAGYGGGLASPRLDSLAEIKSLADASDARDETFDHVFKSRISIGEAITQILTAGRMFWRMLVDKIAFVRDEPRAIPHHFVTDHEIRAGSWSVDYSLATADRPDGVRVNYLEEGANFRPADVMWPDTAVRPLVVEAPGITARQKAWELAAYMAQHLKYVASEVVSFSTERDGRLWLRGEMVAISSHMFGDRFAQGRMVAWNGVRTITLDNDIAWPPSGTFYAEIRTKTGRYFGPVVCTNAGARAFTLDATSLSAVEAALFAAGYPEDTLAEALARGQGAEEASITLGTAATRRFLIAGTELSGDDTKITLGPYAPEVYSTADSPGTTPTMPPVTVPQITVPLILFVNAHYVRALVGADLVVAWQPADASSVQYRVRMSFDAGVTWTQPVSTSQDSVVINMTFPAAVKVQVRGVATDGFEGPPIETDVAAGDYLVKPTAGTVGGVELDADMTQAIAEMPVRLLDEDLAGLIQEKVKRAKDDVAEFLARGKLEGDMVSMKQATTTVQAEVENARAEITETYTVLAAADAALAQRDLDIEAMIKGGGLAASVRETDTAAVMIDDDVSNLLTEAVSRWNADRSDAFGTGSLDSRVTALAQRELQLEADFAGVTGSITQQFTVIATDTLALAQDITTTKATVAAGDAAAMDAAADALAEAEAAGDAAAIAAARAALSMTRAESEIEVSNTAVAGYDDSLAQMIQEKVLRLSGQQANTKQTGSLEGQLMAVASRVVTVSAEAAGAIASVTESTQAIATSQVALAAQVTALEASLGSTSANFMWAMTATVDGSNALVKMEEKARVSVGGAFAEAGRYMEIFSDGGTPRSRHVFYGNTFLIFDGTNPVAAFAVSGGVVTMNLTRITTEIRSATFTTDSLGFPTAGWQLDSTTGIIKAKGGMFTDGKFRAAAADAIEVTQYILRRGQVDDVREVYCPALNATLGGVATDIQVNSRVKISPDYIEVAAQWINPASQFMSYRMNRRFGTSGLGSDEMEFWGSGSNAQYALVIKKNGNAVLRRHNGTTINNSSELPFICPLILDPLWNNGLTKVSVTSAHALSLGLGLNGNVIPFRIPTGYTYLKVKLWGGGGTGSNTDNGGAGGRLFTEVPVTPGEWLFLVVGGPGKAVLSVNDLVPLGFGGKSNPVSGIYVRGGGGLTGIFRGDINRPNAVAIAGGGGGAGSGTAGGGGGAGDAGGTSFTGDYDQMRGEDSSYGADNRCGAGGGYQGGGWYTVVSTFYAGKGGTNFVIGGARNTTNDGSTRGTRTPPGTGDADYAGNAGRGGLGGGAGIQMDGDGGLAVLELLVS